MNAIVRGDECRIKPTPTWMRENLAILRTGSRSDERFVCLIRGPEDQLNVLSEQDGFVLEWYCGTRGGALVAYREGEGQDHRPQRRKGFFAGMLSGPRMVLGSRFSLEAAATVLDAYVGGADDFPALHWKPLYR